MNWVLFGFLLKILLNKVYLLKPCSWLDYYLFYSLKADWGLIKFLICARSIFLERLDVFKREFGIYLLWELDLSLLIESLSLSCPWTPIFALKLDFIFWEVIIVWAKLRLLVWTGCLLGLVISANKFFESNFESLKGSDLLI